ncbi:sigma-70 family RNA polymerase sigma factor [Solitalea sp. MAHUQ-68]|uniref:Sigma-70 family RNA polymerase sigma factor n=1 Tax=Solitalea agri TaxID=2953739 RepID=A0A9X2JCP5_9SPHI|nr:sigma-70 family RNA polymerase sigma factor [Solitalea agri]MCO4292749.1 sigma-70 family RNA polymerase sigma factor [Solitalea agri]
MFIKLFNNPKPKDDSELLALYRRTGDVVHLGELYGRYMELIFAVCFKYFKNEDESKDAVMHIFEKISRDLLHQHVTNWKSWIHVVAKNYCLMQLRSKKYHVEQSMVYLTNDDDDMEFAAEEHHNGNGDKELTLQTMEACIRQLPEEQKICINLFYLEQKSYKEIVEITGFDASKVKSYIQNGKRNLKICVEKNNGEVA